MEENKNNEFEMNSNVNQTSTTTNKQKKSKVVPTLVLIIVILILLLALCVGNMYALAKDYDNVFTMIVSMISGEEAVNGEENIDTDRENNFDDTEESDTNLEEDETPKNELALATIGIDGKECLNFESKDGITRKYTIIDNNEEKNGIEIYKLDKLYLMINSNRLNNVPGQTINIQSDNNYEISNIDMNNVKSIYISDYEQDSSWNYAFFLMNDGTVEWLDLNDALENKNFVAEGKIEGITNVARIAKAEFIYDVDNPNAGKVLSIIGIKEDGEYYDLIDKCLNTNNNESVRENMVIVDSREEEFGVNISKSNGKVYLTLVADELKTYWNVNIEENRTYEITNINGNDIKNIYVFGHGQAMNYPVALFLMSDGTVEWLNVEDALVNKNFIAEGKIENVAKVVRIVQANAGEFYKISNDGAGWVSIVGIREDGNFYDLVDATINSLDETVKTKEGFYQMEYPEGHNEYKGLGISLLENNSCTITFGMTGDAFYGNYEIQNNLLICRLTLWRGEYIRDLNMDIEYHFDIKNSETLEFKQVIGTVGKYYSTLDKVEYEFSEERHFEKGQIFTFEK